MPNPLRVGVVGLGFMGRTHVQAFLSAENAGYHSRLVAIADTKAKDLADNASGGNIKVKAGEVPVDPKKVKMSPNAAGLVADASVEAVSICTPTDTHVGLVIAALAGGKHVLVEKPLALLAEDVLRVHKAASKADRVCMPAMVMRFWPGWEWLHDRVKDGTLGACKSVEFERRGSRPTWNTAFYGDVNRSGGALLDLGIASVTAGAVGTCEPEGITVVLTLTLPPRLASRNSSPAITTRLVVASVSQAMRTWLGSMPVFLASRNTRSTISSEMRSQTLSG